MIFTMKKEYVFWASVCLLLSVAPEPLNAEPEDTGSNLPPLKLLNSFCALKADDGPCKALMKRYFFNIFTQQCEQFFYGGCEGNENRFFSMEECKEKCIIGYKKTELQKGKPDFCFLEEDPGICRGYITRYFYSNESKHCERFKYGGCLGNQNNFETLEECKDTCEDTLNDSKVDNHRIQLTTVNNTVILKPTNASSLWEYNGPSWCLDPADTGFCHASVKRFYYNPEIRKCCIFKYSGCGGNLNNFTSRKSCIRSCKRGFIKRKLTKGLIKTRRKRKKQLVKTVYEEVIAPQI